jgi:hypothetical protein
MLNESMLIVIGLKHEYIDEIWLFVLAEYEVELEKMLLFLMKIHLKTYTM